MVVENRTRSICGPILLAGREVGRGKDVLCLTECYTFLLSRAYMIPDRDRHIIQMKEDRQIQSGCEMCYIFTFTYIHDTR